MQRYNFNLWRQTPRIKSLCCLAYPNLEAAERDAVRMAQALAARCGDGSLVDGWIEVQDMAGVVQSVVPIRLVATHRGEHLEAIRARAA